MTDQHGRTVDSREVARFDALARDWWNPRGRMRPLHRFNPVRLSFLRDAIGRHFGRDPRSTRPFEGLDLLDIGCGGGLLCEPLTRLGCAVTGIDPAPTNVEVARIHARHSGVEVDYRAVTAEIVAAEGRGFDVVLAMEVVEHVPDVGSFVRTAAGLVRPGGLFVCATLNRTLRSYALAIVGAEFVLRWLPVGTHSWHRFVTPDELGRACVSAGLDVTLEQGVTYHPLADAWRLSSDLSVNYMITAVRPG